MLAVESYVQGWASAAGSCPQLTLVIGTNNNNECIGGPSPSTCTTSGAGTWWALVVDSVNSYLYRNGYTPQIKAYAGDDIETEDANGWDCPGATDGFVNAFDQSTTTYADLVNFGTAWLPAGGCWTAADIYYVAYGAVNDVPLPELYTGPAMNTWIDLRTTGNGGSPYVMYFQGVLTECTGPDPLPTSNCPVGSKGTTQWAPAQAWTNFWAGLTNSGAGQSSLNYALNIQNQR